MKIEQTLAGIVEKIETISVDEIKEELRPFMMGMTVTAPMFFPSSFIYRARKLDRNLNKQNLPIEKLHYKREGVSLGRANREGRPVFYASQGKEAVFYEMRVEEGDEVLIGNWQLNDQLLVQAVGYTSQVFSNLGANRSCPVWQNGDPPQPKHPIPAEVQRMMSEALEIVRQEDPNFDVVATFGHEFTRCDDKMYKVTTAIAELYLGGEIANASLRFGGLLYPSVQMSANSDNFALLPWFADNHLTLKGVQHIKVTRREGQVISFDEIDYAVTFSNEGKVIWNGGPSSKTLEPGKSAECFLKPGVDEYGFYNISADGNPCHWVIIDPVTREHINFREKKLEEVA